MNYNQFLNQFPFYYAEQHRGIRLGQALFNFLYINNEGLANKLRGSDIDPFHDDSCIDQFLVYIKSHMPVSEDGEDSVMVPDGLQEFLSYDSVEICDYGS